MGANDSPSACVLAKLFIERALYEQSLGESGNTLGQVAPQAGHASNRNARMSNPLSRLATVAYGASHLPRVAWYVGHSLAVRRLSDAAERRDGKKARPRPHTNLPVPDRRRLYADMAVLFQQDLANIEAGLYPLPADHDGSLLTLLDRLRLNIIVTSDTAEVLKFCDRTSL